MEEAPKNPRAPYSLGNRKSSGPVDQFHALPPAPDSGTLIAHQLGGLDSPQLGSALML